MSLAGGIGGAQLAGSLEGEGLAADAFVRASVPEVATAALVSYTTQVVAGTLYRFTYAGYEGEIQVWSQSWNNGFLKITLPNGTEIANQ